MTALEKEQYSHEFHLIESNIPYFHNLLRSNKISMKEKLSVLEDVNIDIASFLMSIGEEI